MAATSRSFLPRKSSRTTAPSRPRLLAANLPFISHKRSRTHPLPLPPLLSLNSPSRLRRTSAGTAMVPLAVATAVAIPVLAPSRSRPCHSAAQRASRHQALPKGSVQLRRDPHLLFSRRLPHLPLISARTLDQGHEQSSTARGHPACSSAPAKMLLKCWLSSTLPVSTLSVTGKTYKTAQRGPCSSRMRPLCLLVLLPNARATTTSLALPTRAFDFPRPRSQPVLLLLPQAPRCPHLPHLRLCTLAVRADTRDGLAFRPSVRAWRLWEASAWASLLPFRPTPSQPAEGVALACLVSHLHLSSSVLAQMALMSSRGTGRLPLPRTTMKTTSKDD